MKPNQFGFASFTLALIGFAAIVGIWFLWSSNSNPLQFLKDVRDQLPIQTTTPGTGQSATSTENITVVNPNQTSKWKTCAFEKIAPSADSNDRQLVGIKDDGLKDVIIPSIKKLMGWEKEPLSYAKEVSFPAYGQEIYFAKYNSGSQIPLGLYGLNVLYNFPRQLNNASLIYRDAEAYKSILSPDGLKIAALGYDRLYLLDLVNDRVRTLQTAKGVDFFYSSGSIPDFKWLDPTTIQYPVYRSNNPNRPFEIKTTPSQ